MRGCIDQPITRREKRSSTTARYSQPESKNRVKGIQKENEKNPSFLPVLWKVLQCRLGGYYGSINGVYFGVGQRKAG